MEVGDIVRTKSLKLYFSNSVFRGYATVSAGKGKMFVLPYLGTEPDDGSQELDIEARMNLLGWQRMPKAKHAKIVEKFNSKQKK